MALNVPLLRSSFALVTESEPELAARFYDELFRRHPEARPMFAKTAPEVQQQMLTETLVAVVDHLDDAPWLQTHVGLLGRRHVSYGVRPEHFDWVGEALLATLAAIAGPKWSDELASAWGEAYGAIVSLMEVGAEHAA